MTTAELKEKVIGKIAESLDATPVIVEYLESLTRLLSILISATEYEKK